MSAINTITDTLTNTPLPLMIEKLGMSIAQAQSALDDNTIKMISQLVDKKVEFGGKPYSLLALGFVPTFYAFTEATIEARLEFSMTESESMSVGGEVSAEIGVVAVSVNASYARKYEQSASGASAISARLISLPPPETFLNVLRALEEDDN